MEVDSNHEVERADLEADTEVEDAMKNGLKRSSSAPLINQLVAAEAASSSILHTAASRLKPSTSASRWRRWSTSTSLSPVSPGSCSSLPGMTGHLGQGAGWARLNRLKVEETGDVGKLEIQTEREMQRGLCIENSLSQSWEDLSLVS